MQLAPEKGRQRQGGGFEKIGVAAAMKTGVSTTLWLAYLPWFGTSHRAAWAFRLRDSSWHPLWHKGHCTMFRRQQNIN